MLGISKMCFIGCLIPLFCLDKYFSYIKFATAISRLVHSEAFEFSDEMKRNI